MWIFCPRAKVAYRPMARPEVRASLCLRAKDSTYGPLNIKYYFYYMLYVDFLPKGKSGVPTDGEARGPVSLLIWII